jgi:hypothetical protein
MMTTGRLASPRMPVVQGFPGGIAEAMPARRAAAGA